MIQLDDDASDRRTNHVQVDIKLCLIVLRLLQLRVEFCRAFCQLSLLDGQFRTVKQQYQAIEFRS